MRLRSWSSSTALCALGISASFQVVRWCVTRAPRDSASVTSRSAAPSLCTRMSIAIAGSPATHTVVVSIASAPTVALRTTRSGCHACETGTPVDSNSRPSTNSAAVCAPPCEIGGNVTPRTPTRSCATTTVPSRFVSPGGAIMSS